MNDTIPLRVMVSDVWDEVALDLASSASVGEVKRQALAQSRVRGDPARYLVKFRGAEVPESDTLAKAGIPPNANLIVLHRRRRPVR